MTDKKTIKILPLCALFTALIAVGAFIRVPIPLLPFTLQNLFVMLAGLFLGKKYAPVSVAAYVALGLAGLPIFSAGGGMGYVFMPSFGFLPGFIAMSGYIGAVSRRGGATSFKKLLLANLSALIILYAFGLTYYYMICNYVIGTPIGIWSLLVYCFFVFIPGDAAQSTLSAWIAVRLRRYMV